MGKKSNIGQIRQLYESGLTQKQIAQKQIAQRLGYTQTGILGVMRRYNIPVRQDVFTSVKYKDIDLSFFKKIDTEAKAYFLGLMYADGSVRYEEKVAYCASIMLKKDDVGILEVFKQFVCPSYKLTYHKNAVSFRMNRKEICSQLIALGCVPRKSFTLQFPTCVPLELMSYFMRGMSDGDGTITRNKGKVSKRTSKQHINYLWKIISSVDFCSSMRLFLKQNLGINSSIYTWKSKTGPRLATITVGGNLQSLKALQWLYGSGASIWLPRKHEVFAEFREVMREKYPDLF